MAIKTRLDSKVLEFTWPDECVCCGETATTSVHVTRVYTRRAPRVVPRFKTVTSVDPITLRTVERTVEDGTTTVMEDELHNTGYLVPYCLPCQDHVRQGDAAEAPATGALLLFYLVLFLSFFLFIPFFLLAKLHYLFIAIVLAALNVARVMFLRPANTNARPKARPGCTSMLAAVTFEKDYVYFQNEDYGRQFVRLNSMPAYVPGSPQRQTARLAIGDDVRGIASWLAAKSVLFVLLPLTGLLILGVVGWWRGLTDGYAVLKLAGVLFVLGAATGALFVFASSGEG